MSGSTQVTLKPVLPAGASMRLELVGDDQLSGGTGTWSTLNRPRRQDAIQFEGVSGFVYVLPLLLDGMESSPRLDASVEASCRLLQSWSSAVKQATKQPVVLRASGPLQTDGAVRWVITDLQWGAKIRNSAGSRVQQYVTVTLTQYRTASVRKSPAKQSRDRTGN